ncbi:hypothetical protein [Cypionkella sp. TWP1-2-1b2]|uniref:hypothetical protein n=1 Tax=Cypionkella sp. TWP1-2-1b2 TaxID=2804675 RepID=UPI003CEC226E
MSRFSRRGLLVGLAALGIWPLWPKTSKAEAGKAAGDGEIRYGWDPDIQAPTEASLYVAPNGDDATIGSLEQPLRTIQRGVDLLAALPGGSLAIRQGIYREMVKLDALQGRPGANYRIHRYGKERVQITAAEVLTGWQPCPVAEAAGLGIPPEGVFVARIARSRVQHGSIFALNLHEAGQWRSIATDRADISDLTRIGDYHTFHPAQFVLDGADHITAIRDPRLVGVPETQMRQVKVLFYHEPNLVTGDRISGFDPATGTITLSDASRRVQITDKKRVMRYSLQNTGTALRDANWIVRETTADEVAIYLRPTDPANLTDGIEVSLRPTCIDLGSARGVELVGLEVLRAAGQERLDGICIRRTSESDGTNQDLSIQHCRVGENFSARGRGYAALYLRGARGVTIHNTSIGPAHNSFGLFMSDCRQVDLRFLHISEVSNSPARFYTLRNAVLAFSLFEDCAYDAHSNKFNFYEGSDNVLVYGVRTRRVGGYATYQEASRIHFAFCEFDCSVRSQNRALVSQNRSPGAGQGGADGSGDPMAGSTFYYWNNSLLADARTADAANSLSLGPAGTSQVHAFHNNILHGGGFDAAYREGADPSHERRSHNRYTGLSFWQSARYGWRFGTGEQALHIGGSPGHHGLDMRPVIDQELTHLFPSFTDWNVDIDGKSVGWDMAPIGCRV